MLYAVSGEVAAVRGACGEWCRGVPLQCSSLVGGCRVNSVGGVMEW